MKTKQLKSELLYYLFDFLDYDENENKKLYKYIRGTKNVKKLKSIMSREINFMVDSNDGLMYATEYKLINDYNLFETKRNVIENHFDGKLKWKEWDGGVWN